MNKEVMIVTGAGQISMAIARRVGFEKKIVLGDKSKENCEAIAKIMTDAGFDVEPFVMDLSNRESILAMIAKAQEFGEIKYMVNGAGVSPSQAPIEAILKVDLYGTAVLLEEVGKVIAKGGVGVTISSQSGWRMPRLTAEEDRALATTPTEELLDLEILQPENIRDTLHAYQMAKRCNEKRVMYEACRWRERGARLNDIAPAEDREQFIADNQEAFNYGALEEFGRRDDYFEEEGQIISRETIERTIDDGEAYRIVSDGKIAGGVVIKVDGEQGELELLFVSPKAHSKGIGYAA